MGTLYLCLFLKSKGIDFINTEVYKAALHICVNHVELILHTLVHLKMKFTLVYTLYFISSVCFRSKTVLIIFLKFQFSNGHKIYMDFSNFLLKLHRNEFSLAYCLKHIHNTWQISQDFFFYPRVYASFHLACAQDTFKILPRLEKIQTSKSTLWARFSEKLKFMSKA